MNDEQNIYPQDFIELIRQGVSPLSLASRLLSKALDYGQFDKSVRNCHVPGLESISLFHHPERGMIRFYFAKAGSHSMHRLYGPEGHFTIGVHNHKYEIAKIPLMGPLINVRTKVISYEVAADNHHRLNTMFEYGFRSKIRDGEIGILDPDLVFTENIRPDLLVPGDSVIMAPEDLHTVVVHEHHDSAWMVFEGPPAKGLTPLIYSPREDLSLSSDGLYESMSLLDATTRTQRVYDHLLGIK